MRGKSGETTGGRRILERLNKNLGEKKVADVFDECVQCPFCNRVHMMRREKWLQTFETEKGNVVRFYQDNYVCDLTGEAFLDEDIMTENFGLMYDALEEISEPKNQEQERKV